MEIANLSEKEMWSKVKRLKRNFVEKDVIEREKKKKCTKEKLTSVTEIGNVREKLTEREENTLGSWALRYI